MFFSPVSPAVLTLRNLPIWRTRGVTSFQTGSDLYWRPSGLRSHTQFKMMLSSNQSMTSLVYHTCVCVKLFLHTCVSRCYSGVCGIWSVWSSSRLLDPWCGWNAQDSSWNLRRSTTSKSTQTLKNWCTSLMWWVSFWKPMTTLTN